MNGLGRIIRLSICGLESARKGKNSLFLSRRKAGKQISSKTMKITDDFMCCTIHRLRREIRVKDQQVKYFSLI